MTSKKKTNEKNGPARGSRFDNLIAWIKNHRIGSVIIFAGVCLMAISSFVKSVRDLLPTDSKSNETPDQEIPRDTLKLDTATITYNPEPDTSNVNYKPLKRDYKTTVSDSSAKPSAKKSNPKKITLSLVPIQSQPLPNLRANIMNRTSESLLITGVKIDIQSFFKSKDFAEPRLLDPLAMWVVTLPEKKGQYIQLAKKQITLPPDTPVSIDLLFVCVENDSHYNPSEIGRFNITMSFTTDTGDEIPYLDQIKF